MNFTKRLIAAVLIVFVGLLWAFEVERTKTVKLEAEIKALVEYIEKQREDLFVAKIKTGEFCPCVQLTGDGMVQEYAHLVAAGRLTEDQLRNACEVRPLVKEQVKKNDN